MKILIGDYIYESQGIPFTNEDVIELLESHNVNSLDKLNSLLEAIQNKNELEDNTEEEDITPDLEATPEEEEVENKMAADQQGKSKPEATPETAPSETPLEEPTEEPIEPAKEEPTPEAKPSQKTAKEPTKPLTPPKDPPAIEPKESLPPSVEKNPIDWLPSKKLSTLYNNFIDFFDGEKSLRSAGTVIGLEAPGLKQDSKYLQCDITAFVQGTESDPYSTWIKLRRQRNTQKWSFNNPCEVRCNCKSFIYYVSNANVRNKSLAGTPITGKKYIDDKGITRTINFMLPAPKNNPAAIPALCKHLALVSKKLLDEGMITED
jgi:hypothetical protein